MFFFRMMVNCIDKLYHNNLNGICNCIWKFVKILMKVNLFENEDKWSGKIDNWHFEWFCEKVIHTCYDNQDYFMEGWANEYFFWIKKYKCYI